MKNFKRVLGAAIVIAASAATWGLQPANAQAAIKRVDIQKHDLSAPGREVVQARVEIPPGAVIGRHTHPGEEVTYLIEGELQLEVDGKPAHTVRAGEGFTVPMGTVHGARNAGSSMAVGLVTYIVEKGKPVATPAK